MSNSSINAHNTVLASKTATIANQLFSVTLYSALKSQLASKSLSCTISVKLVCCNWARYCLSITFIAKIVSIVVQRNPLTPQLKINSSTTNVMEVGIFSELIHKDGGGFHVPSELAKRGVNSIMVGRHRPIDNLNGGG